MNAAAIIVGVTKRRRAFMKPPLSE
jgi:hypothetical protein